MGGTQLDDSLQGSSAQAPFGIVEEREWASEPHRCALGFCHCYTAFSQHLSRGYAFLHHASSTL